MRTYDEIFQGEDRFEFLFKCHPVNGLEGFRLWYTRVMGMDIKPFHEEWVEPLANKRFKKVAITAPAGSGKCVVGNTRIALTNGSFKKAKDLLPGDNVYSFDEGNYRLVPDRVVAMESNGVKNVFKLTLRCGREIIVTDNHPFYTEGGWKQLKDLSIDDNLLIAKDLKRNNKVIWDKIKSIELVGCEETFDIQVANNPSFVADGFVVHNTQLFGVGLPLWFMWFNVSPQPPFEGLIVSTSETQSKKILDRVKDTILDNELLKELKSDSPREIWSAFEVKVKNGADLSVKPLNPNIRSYHVDYIFSDEVSAYDKVPDGRSVYLECVSSRVTRKNGMMAAVSTPDNSKDLLAHLQSLKDNNGQPIYHSIITHALINSKGEPDLNGESIWPELPAYTKDALLTKRQEIGARAFALQYMCDINTPIDDDEAPFSLSLLTKCSEHYCFEHESDKTDKGEVDVNSHYYAAYDPAFSMEGDYNAILLGKEREGYIKLIGGYRFKGDPDEAINFLRGWNTKFRLEKITVDTNAGGGKVFRDMTKYELPVVSFSFGAAERLEMFREVISRLNSGCVSIPTGRELDEMGNLLNEDSETVHIRSVLLHELTNIKREQTNTGLPTYKSHSGNDDIAMCFLMLVNSIPLTEESLGSVSRHRDHFRPGRDPLKAFNPRPEGLNRLNKRLRWS